VQTYSSLRVVRVALVDVVVGILVVAAAAVESSIKVLFLLLVLIP
jgi:hypothetical protein